MTDPETSNRPPAYWLEMNAAARPERNSQRVTELLVSLWQPTPTDLVSKLPRYTGGRGVDKSARKKETCRECGAYHEVPSIHLDYLGHADTCRLISAVDQAWGWWPQAGFDDLGEPRFVRDKNGYPIRMWIWLDILGVWRPGVGTVEGAKSDPEKELIGDAIRNAAMRFGVGADLWSKAHGESDDTRNYTPRGAAESEPEPIDWEKWAHDNGWQGGMTGATAARDLIRQDLSQTIGKQWSDPVTGEIREFTREDATQLFQAYIRPDGPDEKARPRTHDEFVAFQQSVWLRPDTATETAPSEPTSPLEAEDAPAAPDAPPEAQETAQAPPARDLMAALEDSLATAGRGTAADDAGLLPEAERQPTGDPDDNWYRDHLDKRVYPQGGVNALVAAIAAMTPRELAEAVQRRAGDGTGNVKGTKSDLKAKLTGMIQDRARDASEPF